MKGINLFNSFSNTQNRNRKEEKKYFLAYIVKQKMSLYDDVVTDFDTGSTEAQSDTAGNYKPIIESSLIIM